MQTKLQKIARRVANSTPAGHVVLGGIPPGYRWIWHDLPDPRMHVDVCTNTGTEAHRFWLEADGRRVIETDGPIPAELATAVIATLGIIRPNIEWEWCAMMIDRDLIAARIDPAIGLDVFAYPGPHEYARPVDLADWTKTTGRQPTPDEVTIDRETLSLMITARDDPQTRVSFWIPDLLWQ